GAGLHGELDEARAAVEVDRVTAPEALQAVELAARVDEHGRAGAQHLLRVLPRAAESADLDEEGPEAGDGERRIVDHGVGRTLGAERRPPERRHDPDAREHRAAVAVPD